MSLGDHPQLKEWRAVRSDADPLVLVVVYLGGMDELGPDRVNVEEHDDEVVVRLTSSGRAGYMAGVLRDVRVRLRSPLGGRLVLDLARDIRHQAFRSAAEQAPDAIPWEGASAHDVVRGRRGPGRRRHDGVAVPQHGHRCYDLGGRGLGDRRTPTERSSSPGATTPGAAWADSDLGGSGQRPPAHLEFSGTVVGG